MNPKTFLSAALLGILMLAPFAVRPAQKAKPKTKSPSESSIAAGKSLFEKNCAMCHLTDDVKTKFGPGLKGLFKNKDLPASHKPVTESNVREQIAKGSPDAKPMPMPAFAEKLSAQEMDDLLAYLKTL